MPNDPKIDNKLEEVRPEQPSSAVEKINVRVSPEKNLESIVGVEQRGAVLSEIKNEELAAKIGTTGRDIPGASEAIKIKAIEDILEDGLSDAYLKLPQSARIEFKRKGEITANEISKLLDQEAKGLFWKIVKLIKQWLSIIPSVKSFFMEQEAKIKADRILEEFHLKREGY